MTGLIFIEIFQVYIAIQINFGSHRNQELYLQAMVFC